MKLTLVASLLLVFSNMAFSEEVEIKNDNKINNFYAGASINAINYEENISSLGSKIEFDVNAFSGVMGYQFNKYLALEGRLGFGVGDDTAKLDNVDLKGKLKNYFGLYTKGILPINDTISPYAIIGFTRGKVEASLLGVSVGTSDSDISYGVGVIANINKSTSVNVEYLSYLDKDPVSISGFNIGFIHKF